MSQYFDNDDSIQSSPVCVSCWAGSRLLRFQTDHGVFSRGAVDEASLLLVQNIPPLSGRVLDLGCGYGFIGVYLAAVNPTISLVQSDVNRRALALCEENCEANGVHSTVVESDGFAALTGSFDAVILNPPIHAGKEVCHRLYTEALAHLCADGALYIVIQKKHGAASTKAWLQQQGAVITERYAAKGTFVWQITINNSNV
ncbi:MAG: methyltransferase [Oscillospiraceae bacterium]|nr:methyltransferase [Oscillospiraceae bacterium]